MQDHSLLLETSLERAAELLGDITAPAMARFYEAHPDARGAFEHHSFGEPAKLEAEMVENALHWAITWLDRKPEIRIHLGSSVPYHEEVLEVTVPWYRGLQEAVIDVIVATIPHDQPAELELWRAIRLGLGEMIEASKSGWGAHT